MKRTFLVTVNIEVDKDFGTEKQIKRQVLKLAKRVIEGREVIGGIYCAEKVKVVREACDLD